MAAALLEIPVQVFTNDMSIARSLMRKSNPSYDDVLQISGTLSVVYRQHFNYLISTPAGPGPHIDLAILIARGTSRGEAAEAIVEWLASGRVEIFSFDRLIIELSNKYEARLAIEEMLARKAPHDLDASEDLSDPV